MSSRLAKGTSYDRPLDVDDLVARAEIVDVLSRYVRGVDRCDPELMSSCYHPDAIDDHGTFVGPAKEFVGFVTGDRSRRWAMTTHFLAPPMVVRDGDVAAVDTYCQAHHRRGARSDHDCTAGVPREGITRPRRRLVWADNSDYRSWTTWAFDRLVRELLQAWRRFAPTPERGPVGPRRRRGVMLCRRARVALQPFLEGANRRLCERRHRSSHRWWRPRPSAP